MALMVVGTGSDFPTARRANGKMNKQKREAIASSGRLEGKCKTS